MTQLSGPRSTIEGYLERRIVVALLCVVVTWLLLLARLFFLQVVEGDKYLVSAQRQSVRTHRVAASRGIIFDRTGEILTDSRPSFDVLVVPHDTPDLGATLHRVAEVAGLDAGELQRAIGSPSGPARFQPLSVARDLDWEAVARVRSWRWALPGVLTEAVPVRSYLFGPSAAHTLGWLGEVSPEQLRTREFQGYRAGDRVGRDGVERLLDRDLRGRDGGENVLVDAHGREGAPVGAIEAQPGHNVALTLDHRLQTVAERAFDEAGAIGAVVALDPRNGEVLVLLSRPAFDPNRFAAGIDRAEWARLVDDPRKPLHNRALQGQYPPGSTYKVVTALAGLEQGVIDDDFEVQCTGSHRLGRRRYRCWKRGGHGAVQLHRALVESCDVFFYRVGEELGALSEGQRGVDIMAHYASELGFGKATGIDLGGERAGLVPTSLWKRRRYGEPWMRGETLSVAIGQGFNLVTPVQLASAYAAIANGGVPHRPFVVKSVTDAHGRVLRETAVEAGARLAVSGASLDRVRAALHGAVHDPHGTGAVMRGLPDDVEAAGKTGTAQVVALEAQPDVEDEDDIPVELRDHAWFVTYAPAAAPRIVVAVLVEHGGHGATAAAPIAREVVAEFLTHEAAPQLRARAEGAGDAGD